MKYLIILAIFFSANYMFYLLPWTHIPGIFNMTDIGLVIIGLVIVFALIDKRFNFRIFHNYATALIVFIVLIFCMSISLAALYFNQSVIDGILGIRSQFFYLSYFVFLYLLRSLDQVKKLLTVISYVAIFIVIVSIINYFGMTLFYHEWAEGHGIRSGVVRAYVPAMALIALSYFWNVSLIENTFKHKYKNTANIVVYLFAFVFRQTRGHFEPPPV